MSDRAAQLAKQVRDAKNKQIAERAKKMRDALKKGK